MMRRIFEPSGVPVVLEIKIGFAKHRREIDHSRDLSG